MGRSFIRVARTWSGLRLLRNPSVLEGPEAALPASEGAPQRAWGCGSLASLHRRGSAPHRHAADSCCRLRRMCGKRGEQAALPQDRSDLAAAPPSTLGSGPCERGGPAFGACLQSVQGCSATVLICRDQQGRALPDRCPPARMPAQAPAAAPQLRGTSRQPHPTHSWLRCELAWEMQATVLYTLGILARHGADRPSVCTSPHQRPAAAGGCRSPTTLPPLPFRPPPAASNRHAECYRLARGG